MANALYDVGYDQALQNMSIFKRWWEAETDGQHDVELYSRHEIMVGSCYVISVQTTYRRTKSAEKPENGSDKKLHHPICLA